MPLCSGLRTPYPPITLEFYGKQFQAGERRRKDAFKVQKWIQGVHMWAGEVMLCAIGGVWREEDSSVESVLTFPFARVPGIELQLLGL